MKTENRILAVKQIIQTLINTRGLQFTRGDIDKAVMENRGWDQRTMLNWFNYLWKMEYIQQPSPGIFQLNLNKITCLEVKLPPNQTQLVGNDAHV